MADDVTPDPRIRPILRSRSTLRRLRPAAVRGEVVPEDAGLQTVLVELEAEVVPGTFSHFRWYRIADSFYLVTMPASEVDKLALHPDVLLIEAGSPLSTLSDMTSEAPKSSPAPVVATSQARDGAGVVVGIIDDGLDFVHDDFRDELGRTRVAYLWDQRLKPQDGERTPAEFGFGVEYDSAAINRALDSTDPFAVVRHTPEPYSHGTHVAGIAAGNGHACDASYPPGTCVGLAPRATIIFVQPGLALGGDTSVDSYRATLSVTVSLATAVAYIFEKARQLNLPCVINLSRSSQTNSRDGETLLEHALDSLLRRRGRALVATTGNVGLGEGHASGQLGNGEVRRLTFGMLPGSRATAFEMWHGSSDRFRIRLVNPAGRATPWIVPGQEFNEADDGSGNRTSIDYEPLTSLNGDSSIVFEVAPAPPPDGGSGSVAFVNWHVELEAVDVRDGRFDCWMIDARKTLTKFAENDRDHRLTIAPPATAFSTIAVGFYDSHATPAHVHPESSRGPTRDGRTKPDLVAPGYEITSSAAMGGPKPKRTGNPVRFSTSGSSQAAPHVTGTIARMFQAAPGLSTAQIRNLLITGARRAEGVSGFQPDWGHGMLDTERTLALLEEIFADPAQTGNAMISRAQNNSARRSLGTAQGRVSVEEIAGQEFVEVCAGIPVFRLADGRYHVVSHFAVDTLVAAREAAQRLAKSAK